MEVLLIMCHEVVHGCHGNKSSAWTRTFACITSRTCRRLPTRRGFGGTTGVQERRCCTGPELSIQLVPWQAAGVQIQVKVCKLHMEVPDVMLQIPTSKRSRGDLWG